MSARVNKNRRETEALIKIVRLYSVGDIHECPARGNRRSADLPRRRQGESILTRAAGDASLLARPRRKARGELARERLRGARRNGSSAPLSHGACVRRAVPAPPPQGGSQGAAPSRRATARVAPTVNNTGSHRRGGCPHPPARGNRRSADSPRRTRTTHAQPPGDRKGRPYSMRLRWQKQTGRIRSVGTYAPEVRSGETRPRYWRMIVTPLSQLTWQLGQLRRSRAVRRLRRQSS